MGLSKYVALLVAVCLLVCLAACTGELTQTHASLSDAGSIDVDASTTRSDVRASEDTGQEAVDSSIAGSDSGITDANSSRGDTDTPTGDTGESVADAGSDARPAEPCDGMCGVHAHCADGGCVCDNGFGETASSGCEAIVAGDPASHTQAEVCQRFGQAFEVSDDYFVPASSGQCAPGTLTHDGIGDAVRALTFFRWMCGLAAVSANNADYNRQAQLCAVTSAHNPANASAHHPEPSATCYTAEGATGAGSSNIAWSYSMTGPSMIDQFMDDQGNDTTLGHRRWCLNPGLEQVGVGLYSGDDTTYPWAGCLKVIGTAGAGGPAPPLGYIAYPAAGFVPKRLAMTSLWSLSNSGIDADFTVTVTEVSSGADMPVTIKPLTGNYGPATLAWARQGWNPESGKTYKVVVSDDTKTITYEVKPVDC